MIYAALSSQDDRPRVVVFVEDGLSFTSTYLSALEARAFATEVLALAKEVENAGSQASDGVRSEVERAVG